MKDRYEGFISSGRISCLSRCTVLRVAFAALSFAGIAAGGAYAQQTDCPIGSPCATAPVSGKQLPPLPDKFEGKIERNAAQSKPWWAPRVVPPKGAPNVLLIMTDDSGFGVPSTALD